MIRSPFNRAYGPRILSELGPTVSGTVYRWLPVVPPVSKIDPYGRAEVVLFAAAAADDPAPAAPAAAVRIDLGAGTVVGNAAWTVAPPALNAGQVLYRVSGPGQYIPHAQGDWFVAPAGWGAVEPVPEGQVLNPSRSRIVIPAGWQCGVALRATGAGLVRFRDLEGDVVEVGLAAGETLPGSFVEILEKVGAADAATGLMVGLALPRVPGDLG